jgi:PTS system mannose-specific IID component
MLRSWLRTLLVQASWNYDRMLGLGVGHAIEPLLRDLPGGREGTRYREAVGRGSQFFNAHPYMAGIAIGAEARAEHENLPPEHVRRLRGALAGPLGSLGDKLIWAGVLPTAVGLGLMVAAVTTPLAGALAFLVLYNVAHFTLRAWGLSAGWKYGTGIAKALAAPVLQRGLRLAGPAAALAVGLALPPVAVLLVGDLALNARIGVGLVAVVGIAVARWVAPSFGGLRFGVGALVIALVVGVLWA